MPAKRSASSATKKAIAAFIDQIAPEWKDVSLRIHDHPELGLNEKNASQWLSDALARQGFEVTRNVAGLATAFIGRPATKTKPKVGPSIAFLAEYDALPDLGHACSHNLIGSAACLAAIGIAQATQGKGRIQVFGCPAEEFFGGKARLLERGLFRGVDAALMAHGYFLNLGMRPAIGRASVIFEFFGTPAHASTVPERGINALDAMIQTFNNIAMLRQQVRQEARIHGIITHGGKAPNVIPDYTRAEFYVRSRDTDYLRELEKKVVACARAASTATGTRVKVSSEGYTFLPIRPNATLAHAYEDNVRFLGHKIDALPAESGYGSTDFGNVSQALPALHGYFRIVSHEVRPHSREFAAACRTPRALDGMVSAAKAMALTAFDLIEKPALLRAARDEWKRGVEVDLQAPSVADPNTKRARRSRSTSDKYDSKK
jgi:amidohydrolase